MGSMGSGSTGKPVLSQAEEKIEALGSAVESEGVLCSLIDGICFQNIYKLLGGFVLLF